MKKMLLLSLFIACLFVSCNKEDKLKLSDEIDFNGYIIKDAAGIDELSIMFMETMHNFTTLTGIKDDNLIWIGIYDTSTKEEIYRLTTHNPSIDPLTVVRTKECYPTDIGFFITLSVNFNQNYSRSDGIVIVDKEKDKVTQHYFSNVHKEVSQSYGDKILVRNFNNPDLYHEIFMILSTSGELIADAASGLWPDYEDENKKLLAGLTSDDHLVVWLYNAENQLLQEWRSDKKTDRNVKIHVGYSEYIDGYIINILAPGSKIVETPWGYAIQPFYYYQAKNHYLRPQYQDILFLNQGEIYKGPIDKKAEEIYNWYDESILVIADLQQYYIYTPEGKLLMQGGAFPYEIKYGNYLHHPLSYESVICHSRSSVPELFRYDLKPEPTRKWYVYFPDYPHDSRINWQIVDQKDKLWTYRVEITEYSGAKEILNFIIDIETGEINHL